jgi:diguanylate cyclase (GGDEF)-like protein
VVLALAAEAAVYQNMRSRVRANDEQFAATQRLRLQRIEQRVDTFFSDAEQLVRVGAQACSSTFGNLTSAETIVADMYRARKSADVFGIGVFYQPYAFDRRTQMVSIYDREGSVVSSLDRALPGGGVQVLFDGPARSKVQNYTYSSWYERATESPGETRWYGPYVDQGDSYISTLDAFRQDGHIGGVFSVDILTANFKRLLGEGLGSGDIAWVQSGTSGRWLVGTAKLPADATTRIGAAIPLRVSGAILHLSSDASALYMTNTQIEGASAALMVLIAAFALVAAVILVQRWEREAETRVLQEHQARLETEISVARRIETELRRAAYTDSLTGLPNRAAYMDTVRGLLEQGRGAGHAVFLVDLDRFNIVNETMGHIAGDELLRVLAARLQAAMRADTLVARLGGDEFVVVAPVQGEAIAGAAARILRLIGEPVLLSGQTLTMRASVGVATFDETYTTPVELLRDADIAVYRAKAMGRARFEIFDATMRARVASESELESDLRRAIDRGEFIAHYQPLIRVATGEVASFEALIRWLGPSEQPRSAAEFIPFAEARGLVAALDTIMLRHVCSQSAAIGALFPGTSIAANISAAELASQTLPGYIAGLLEQYNVPASRLKLEITETAMMTQVVQAQATLEALRELGVAVVLDDFGTGYSSLAYLQRLPIVGLKIDQSFIENLPIDSHALEIVRSIVALAGSLGLDTTAEGVETEAQLAIIGQLGVTFAQGFLFSKAVEVAALGALQKFASTREA